MIKPEHAWIVAVIAKDGSTRSLGFERYEPAQQCVDAWEGMFFDLRLLARDERGNWTSVLHRGKWL